MKRRWIALLLALTMAASLLAGCTKKSDTPAQPEQGQTEQEENQPQQEENPAEEEQPDVTPENPDDAEKPADEQKPDEEEKPEEEPELTEEQKRRLRIEQAVEESTIWAADRNTTTSLLRRFSQAAWRTFCSRTGTMPRSAFPITLTQTISG